MSFSCATEHTHTHIPAHSIQ